MRSGCCLAEGEACSAAAAPPLLPLLPGRRCDAVRPALHSSSPASLVSAPSTHAQAVIYNPLNGKWSKKGSLGEMMQMRLYHSTAVLLPSCKVMPPTDGCALCTTACCQPLFHASPADIMAG